MSDERKPNPAAHVDELIAVARDMAKETGQPLTPDEEVQIAAAVQRDMPGPCPCEVCAARRKEPFLAPCFDVGAQWTSHDGGMTWSRFPGTRGGWKLTAIAINATSGEVTFKVSR